MRKILVLTPLLAFIACSTGSVLKMSGSDLNPAAEGFVETDSTTNNNTRVDVEVKHLVAPGRIERGASTYILWARPTIGDTTIAQNLGALKVDEDLNGRMSTVLPHQNFQLFITAEPTAMVTVPSGARILSGNLTRLAE